ncbi:MAG: DUF1573 domain-containing protein [candidate division Zixibacteria bacterium]|nr:DUF1573 domain-containing protein [candidate division Zixibacteria bacterium]
MKWPLLTLMLLLAALSVSADAKLEILSNRFDFGMIPNQSTVSHQFWFRASGSDTVKIQTIKTGCQCTTMPLEQDWLAPGDSMKVKVTWELGRRIGNTGQYPRVFIVDNPEPHYISLIGNAAQALDILRPVSIKPYKATFARTSSHSIDSVGFTLTNHSDEDLDLNIVSYPSESYEVSFPAQVAGGSAAEGYVKITPQTSDSEFKGSITIEFEGAKKNRLTIPVQRKFY